MRPFRTTPERWLVSVIAVGVVGFALVVVNDSGAANLTGSVRVVDGDTISIGGTRIRLTGIDAPEASQLCKGKDGRLRSCGATATHALVNFVNGKHVACNPHGHDRYGRTLGTCFADGENVNAWMVRRGYAWAYKLYSWRYVMDEWQAWAEGAGIWAGEAQPAWEYRHKGS